MNRTIKFRAWDIKRNRWLDEFQVMPNGTVRYRLPVEESPDRLEWQEMKDIILLQFTGLHDKNGKEIYEGDIVRTTRNESEIHGKVNAVVVFMHACFRLKTSNRTNMWPLGNKVSRDDAEVIGNLYENPDLL